MNIVGIDKKKFIPSIKSQVSPLFDYFSKNSGFLFTEVITLTDITEQIYEFCYSQYEYLQSLSIEDVLTIFIYTKGTFRVINNYIRTGEIIVMSKDDLEHLFFVWCGYHFSQGTYTSLTFIELYEIFNTDPVSHLSMEVLNYFIQKLDWLIKDSPTTKIELLVTRGTKTYEEQKGFISTSLHNNLSFTGKNCCLLQIIIPIGTPCLFIVPVSYHDNEYELLLSINTKLILIETKQIVIQSEYEPDRLMNVYTFRKESELARIFNLLQPLESGASGAALAVAGSKFGKKNKKKYSKRKIKYKKISHK
jgi:hypothetical protein